MALKKTSKFNASIFYKSCKQVILIVIFLLMLFGVIGCNNLCFHLSYQESQSCCCLDCGKILNEEKHKCIFKVGISEINSEPINFFTAEDWGEIFKKKIVDNMDTYENLRIGICNICTVCGEIQNEYIAFNASESFLKDNTHDWSNFNNLSVFNVESSCSIPGITFYYCTDCDSVCWYCESPSHTFGPSIIIKDSTNYIEGTKKSICTICGVEKTDTVPVKGTYSSDPLIVSANKLYNDAKGTKIQTYLGKYVKVTGVVTDVTRLSDIAGYYLIGGKSRTSSAKGLVCWVDGNPYRQQGSVGIPLIKEGESATFVGYIRASDYFEEGIGENSLLEIVSCKHIK